MFLTASGFPQWVSPVRRIFPSTIPPRQSKGYRVFGAGDSVKPANLRAPPPRSAMAEPVRVSHTIDQPYVADGRLLFLADNTSIFNPLSRSRHGAMNWALFKALRTAAVATAE